MQTRTALFRIVLVVSALTLNALQAIHAAPLLQDWIDLVVLQIDWTPDPPSMGDIVHLTAHVENQGTLNTSPWSQVGVRMFIDGISIGDDYAGNIAPGTTECFDFYWIATSGCHTVRAVADYGDYIPESDEGNNEREESLDVICPTPSAPSLSSPSNGSDTCDTTPYFDWSSVSGATSYRIQVDDRSNFTSPAVDRTTSTSNYTPGAALAPDTYYWRVRASNSCGDGSWSSVWSVTILSTPGTPNLVSPSNGATTDDNTPTFDWDSVTGATSYRVQVDDNPDFTSPEVDQTTFNTSYTPSGALADGTYHWWVQASNSCGSGSWSAAWSFTTETPCPTPSAPSLSSPANGSSTCDTTPYFDWSSVSGATSYRIQIDHSSSFSSPAIDTTTSNSNYTPGMALTPGTMYYWRVNATNLDRGGTGPWSTVWSFSLTTPDNMVYFEPQYSSTSFCNTTSVDMKVDTTDFKSGQIKFTYNSACADVIGWARNISDFPAGTWESGTSGEEWITFSTQDAITGAYSIGTLTIRSISEEPCTTALDFVEDGPMTSKLFDDWGSEVSAAWQDGTFQGRGSIFFLPIIFRNHTPGTEQPKNPSICHPILHPQTGPSTRAQGKGELDRWQPRWRQCDLRRLLRGQRQHAGSVGLR